jgi:hypothetical protein
MQQFRVSLLATTGLLIAGCSSAPKTEVATEGEPAKGVAADRQHIQESLATMDTDVDREVMTIQMEALIADGLYDPNNKNPLTVGEEAPDFSLMPLKFYDFQIDRGITADNAGMLFEPVTLSDFEGNLPVVLIFGSYT